MKISVIGANGQLGTDLVKVLISSGHTVQPLTRSQLDITDLDSVQASLTSFGPDAVINTAAFVNVNLAETSVEAATLVNVQGAANVARVAEGLGAATVYISTDFIFDGAKPFGQFYETSDAAGPLNVYGRTKYEGELAVAGETDNLLIYRISSVFGAAGSSGKGGNFIEAILRKVRAGEVATVISDNSMTPTYTPNASVILEALLSQGVRGMEHGSASNACSWFDLAHYSASKLGLGDLVIPSESEPNPAVKRPANSALSTKQLAEYGISSTPWQSAVDAYLLEKGYL